MQFSHAQSSRLAEFGGLGISFNICGGTLGSLAMFTAIRNASSRVSNRTRLADDAVATWEHADNVVPMYAGAAEAVQHSEGTDTEPKEAAN